MKIVHTESSCGWGGQEIRILTEARGMIERGHQVSVVCPPTSGICKAGPDYGVPVVALPIYRKRPADFLALRRWLRDARGEVDVINTHSSTDSWLVALACATLDKAPPIVRTRHLSTEVSRDRFTRWLYTRAARHVVTTGEALRQHLAAHNGFPLEAMTSVPTGIDPERFAPGARAAARAALGLPAAGPLLAIVSTLRSWKGHLYLLEALEQLPQTTLVIVGDGPYKATIEREVDQRQLSGRVVWAGQQRDVAPWLRAADVFALPSYANEGVPQAILQAMMCGLPVVSTTVGAIGEAVAEGETGFLVPPRDADALRLVLARLVDSPPLAATLGQAGRERALRLFSRDVMLDRMETVFRAAMQPA